jgi:hypothetical protein
MPTFLDALSHPLCDRSECALLMRLEEWQKYSRQGDPVKRKHECVFGVLALESEPVDPRL